MKDRQHVVYDKIVYPGFWHEHITREMTFGQPASLSEYFFNVVEKVVS